MLVKKDVSPGEASRAQWVCGCPEILLASLRLYRNSLSPKGNLGRPIKTPQAPHSVQAAKGLRSAIFRIPHHSSLPAAQWYPRCLGNTMEKLQSAPPFRKQSAQVTAWQVCPHPKTASCHCRKTWLCSRVGRGQEQEFLPHDVWK